MKFEYYLDSAIKWRWRLRADNGKILADSAESYNESTDLNHAIDLIKTGAATAEVEFIDD